MSDDEEYLPDLTAEERRRKLRAEKREARREKFLDRFLKMKSYRDFITEEEYEAHVQHIKDKALAHGEVRRTRRREELQRIHELLNSYNPLAPKAFFISLIDAGIIPNLTGQRCPKCSRQFMNVFRDRDPLLPPVYIPAALVGQLKLTVYRKHADVCCWRCRTYTCKARLSIRTGMSGFFQRHNRITILKLLTYVFRSWLRLHSDDEIFELYKFSSRTIVKLRESMRATIREFYDSSPVYKFGNNGEVEIDELVLKKYFKPPESSGILRFKNLQGLGVDEEMYEYTPSRSIKKLWVLGITERGTDANPFYRVHFELMMADPNYDIEDEIRTKRGREELDRIVAPRLARNSHVMTDKGPIYVGLRNRLLRDHDLHIIHNLINKRSELLIKKNDGHPNRKIYTQTIENKWKLFRKLYRSLSRTTAKNLPSVLREITWRVENKHTPYTAILDLLRAPPNPIV